MKDEVTTIGAHFVKDESCTVRTSSFILHPSDSGGGATRTRRGALAPGGLARRCTTICAAPPNGRCGSRTHRSARLRQFSGLLGVPMPNLPCLAGAPGFEPGRASLEPASLTFSLRPRAMHQEGLEPPRPA